MNDNPKEPAQLALGGIIANLPAVRAAKKVNTLSRVHRRLLEPLEGDLELSFQHSVFCQTSLPYQNPGDDVREWHRTQGTTMLQIQAGYVLHQARNTTIPVGLPWGVKPRLILAHLNTQALQQGSPVIEIESSLSAFVQRIRGFKHGREIRSFKEQLTRLSNSAFRFAVTTPEGPEQTNAFIIDNFKLWPDKDERQRVLWPTTIEFSDKYFASLVDHAIPLHEGDLGALAHSALAIDLYSWLAQRLHRVHPNRSAFISWAALKEQFGPDYGRVRDFKRFFRAALRQVKARYKDAQVEVDDCGMKLHHSAPPVKRLAS